MSSLASQQEAQIRRHLPDFPAGPLDEYRRRASFDWRKMKLLMETAEVVLCKQKILAILERDPLFNRPLNEELTRHQFRELTFKRMKRLIEYDFLNEDEFIQSPLLAVAISQCIGLADWSLGVKKFVSHEYFVAATTGASTGKHKDFTDQVKRLEALGCISLTELGHGSNTRAMQTTATFDPRSQQFVINTPHIGATKCWSGGMGQLATHALLFAQLRTPDGKQHGLHNFLVPVRDPKTLLPYPGVTIGDMGPKIGLNGVDNGFARFDNYRISKDRLLNRNADISPDGQYVSRLRDKSKRMSATLGILSAGRMGIFGVCLLNMQKSLVIAVRYGCVRRQFGPGQEEEAGGGKPPSPPPAAPLPEWPLIEYQTHQWRLIPYLAASYTLARAYLHFFNQYIDFFIRVTYKMAPAEELSDMGAELHAIACSSKALASWLAADCVQECREACGGHGYLQSAGLGELRNDHDSNVTYEGDNNVITQQTSNLLVKLYKESLSNSSQGRPQTLSSPYGTLNFVLEVHATLASYQMPALGPRNLQEVAQAYRFLASYLLRQTSERLDEQMRLNQQSPFVARARSQVYYAKVLALVFFELSSLEGVSKEFATPKDEQERLVVQLSYLYGLWALEKWSSYLFEANAIKPNSATLRHIRQQILDLCAQLKDNALTLAEVWAPPDWLLRSSIGKSDGRLYENLYESFTSSQGCFERPAWYEEFTIRKPKLASLKPKL